MSWRHPGRIGALLYAGAALLLSGVVAIFTRLRLAKRRGRRRAAEELPEGAIIVISNHASYADGALLALVCRRMGRSVRLLATAGVFRAPLLGGLITRLGFIPVERGSDRAAGAWSGLALGAIECERATPTETDLGGRHRDGGGSRRNSHGPPPRVAGGADSPWGFPNGPLGIGNGW